MYKWVVRLWRRVQENRWFLRGPSLLRSGRPGWCRKNPPFSEAPCPVILKSTISYPTFLSSSPYRRHKKNTPFPILWEDETNVQECQHMVKWGVQRVASEPPQVPRYYNILCEFSCKRDISFHGFRNSHTESLAERWKFKLRLSWDNRLPFNKSCCLKINKIVNKPVSICTCSCIQYVKSGWCSLHAKYSLEAEHEKWIELVRYFRLYIRNKLNRE